jgi:putative oxidoreductase
MQLLSCSLIIFGWQARLGVLGLMLFLLLATLLFHRFWRMPDEARRNLARINVMNNCAIFGGLLLLLQHTARD